MAGFFSKLLGLQDNIDFAPLIAGGAIIIDVRTKEEYLAGHATNSQNIPLDYLKQKISKLDKKSTLIVVCASGMRSKEAASILKREGFDRVYNGGSWTNFGKG